MNYYFDVKLNFLNEYYSYYEWDKQDNISDIRKIPIVRLNFQDFIKVFTNKVKVSNEFLDKIKNKTISTESLVKYAVIFTDANNSIAVLFNSIGESILVSSLNYSDELNIEEIGYKLKKEKVDFSLLAQRNFSRDLRFDEKMKNYVKTEINNLLESKNFDKLKYLYNEVCQVPEKDISVIVDKLKNISERDMISYYELLNYIF